MEKKKKMRDEKREACVYENVFSRVVDLAAARLVLNHYSMTDQNGANFNVDDSLYSIRHVCVCYRERKSLIHVYKAKKK